MKYSELKRKIQKSGCYFLENGKEHDKWKNAKGAVMNIPRHDSQEVPDGMLNKIKKWAGI